MLFAVLTFAVHAACFSPPVDGPIVEPFRMPPCAYCAGGHRGVEYATTPGTPVRSVAPGTVAFAGAVAGIRYVTVDGDDGLTFTYGMLAGFRVQRGQRVPVGDHVGTTGERLYFGVRRDDEYVDPGPLLAQPSWRPRLVPTSGGPARPARPGPPRCADDRLSDR